MVRGGTATKSTVHLLILLCIPNCWGPDTKMEGLPFLPGNTFVDPTVSESPCFSSFCRDGSVWKACICVKFDLHVLVESTKETLTFDWSRSCGKISEVRIQHMNEMYSSVAEISFCDVNPHDQHLVWIQIQIHRLNMAWRSMQFYPNTAPSSWIEWRSYFSDLMFHDICFSSSVTSVITWGCELVIVVYDTAWSTLHLLERSLHIRDRFHSVHCRPMYSQIVLCCVLYACLLATYIVRFGNFHGFYQLRQWEAIPHHVRTTS